MRIAIATLALSTMPLVAQYPKTLAGMHDRYRPLLVFEGGNAKQTEQQLMALASHSSELRDRQVVIVGAEGTNKSVPTFMLSEDEWRTAQRRFKVKPDEFTVILLGKDGGEKMRSHQPIPWDQLQTKIDAMPMRKEEAGRR